MSSGTAREHVRVARALRDLPVIRARFAAGRLSYAKVRALTRIATAATEAGLAELAGPMTANQLERFARAHRQVTQAGRRGRPGAAAAGVAGSRRTVRCPAPFRLPPLQGAVLLKALRAACADLAGEAAGPPAGVVIGQRARGRCSAGVWLIQERPPGAIVRAWCPNRSEEDVLWARVAAAA